MAQGPAREDLATTLRPCAENPQTTHWAHLAVRMPARPTPAR